MPLLTKLAVIAGGGAVGIATGFLGGGGGTLLVPLLTYGCKLPVKKAHATAVTIILPLSVISGAIYAASGFYPIKIGLLTASGVVAGGIAGALLMNKIPSRILSYVFYIIMIVAGLKAI